MDDVVQCPRCHYIRLREIGESRLALDRRADSLLVAVREHIEGWSHRLRWVPLLIGAAGILVVGAGAFLFFWFVFAVLLKVALF